MAEDVSVTAEVVEEAAVEEQSSPVPDEPEIAQTPSSPAGDSQGGWGYPTPVAQKKKKKKHAAAAFFE